MARSVFVRGLVGFNEGEGIWYRMTDQIQSAQQAHAAARELLSKMSAHPGPAILAYEPETGTWAINDT
jgi:hypothetical protein